MMTIKNFPFILSCFILVLASCGDSSKSDNNALANSKKEIVYNGEVTVYANANTPAYKELVSKFEKESGIKVNWVVDSGDKLLIKLQEEGESSAADIIILEDAARLDRGVKRDLFKPIDSPEIESRVPAKYRNTENYWFGLTKYAKVCVGHESNGLLNDVSAYYDLTSSKFKNRIYSRSGTHVSSQSFLASLLVHNGSEELASWVSSFSKNFSRSPKGNDRSQIMALKQDDKGLAFVNSYEYYKLLINLNEKNKSFIEGLKVVYPKHKNGNTHMNVKGMALSKNCKNEENAMKFMLFLSSVENQEYLASSFGDFPIHPKASSDLLKGISFKEDIINLSALGDLNGTVSKVAKEKGWN